MSFWKRLFGHKCDLDLPASPSGWAEKYLSKYQKFIDIMTECEAARDLLERLRLLLADHTALDRAAVKAQGAEFLVHLGQALDLLRNFGKQKPEALAAAFEDLASRLNQAFSQSAGDDPELFRDTVSALLFASQIIDPSENAPPAYGSLQDILEAVGELRLQEMFCLSLHTRVSKKQAVSLITGRLVPILVIDVGGGLSKPGPNVGLDDVASIPYKAFLTGILSIPWPKARPLDVKGFISVVGVTSTTPRAEDQLQKISFAILAREYMNFSLCLGYHASTVEAYVGETPRCNYIRFHYQGGAASVERRVRRLRLIRGILTRLGFEVSITGDLLDARKTGEDQTACLKMLEILGRLEVFTKQMDMVLSDDDVIFGYIDDFLANHC